MRNALLSAGLLAASLLFPACGGADVGAVIGTGDVQLRDADGLREVIGSVPLGSGASLVARAESVLHVTCGGTLSAEHSITEDGIRPGTAAVLMDPGAELRRREGAAFDLVSGSLRIGTPHAVSTRIVVFHGTTFLEVPTDNRGGFEARLAADGDALSVEVTKGEVLLHSTGATQKELHYVTLGPGESATATPGSKPVKRDAAD